MQDLSLIMSLNVVITLVFLVHANWQPLYDKDGTIEQHKCYPLSSPLLIFLASVLCMRKIEYLGCFYFFLFLLGSFIGDITLHRIFFHLLMLICKRLVHVLVSDGNDNLYFELWRACAGPFVTIPCVGEKVFYFPQGHVEMVISGYPFFHSLKYLCDSKFQGICSLFFLMLLEVLKFYFSRSLMLIWSKMVLGECSTTICLPKYFVEL